MAERRMFHKTVVGSDGFLDLPVGAQALYFHLGMHADDDGFVIAPRQLVRMLRRPKKDLMALVEKGYLLELDGVVVLTHWLVSNSLKSDRLRLPQFPELAERVFIREDRVYTLTPEGVCLLESRRNAMESKRNPKVREGKVTENKIRKDNLSECEEEGEFPAGDGIGDTHARIDTDQIFGFGSDQKEKELKIMRGKLGKGVVLMSDEQMADLLEKLGLDAFDKYTEKLAAFIIEKNARVANHYQTILKWWREDQEPGGAR